MPKDIRLYTVLPNYISGYVESSPKENERWREIERGMEKGIKCRVYMEILNERQYSNTVVFTTTFIHCHKKYSLLNSIFPVLIFSVKVNDVVSWSFELFDTLGFGRVTSLNIFCCN